MSENNKIEHNNKRTYLVRYFCLSKNFLPRGKYSRWECFRTSFSINKPEIIWAAKRAIWEISEQGDKTRTAWEQEYRHQRKLSGISRGKNYDFLDNNDDLVLNHPQIDF